MAKKQKDRLTQPWPHIFLAVNIHTAVMGLVNLFRLMNWWLKYLVDNHGLFQRYIDPWKSDGGMDESSSAQETVEEGTGKTRLNAKGIDRGAADGLETKGSTN